MSHWMERAPTYLRGHKGPEGEVIDTPIDRRWLWRIEGFLAVHATTDYQRQMATDLRQYLSESCDHYWRAFEFDGDTGRQCLWCCWVTWDQP